MEFNYNIHINTHYINKFIGIIVLLFILFIIVSYFVLKILKSSLDEYNFFFYKYNQQSQKILDKYGDYKITKLYLVRQPFSKFLTLLLNILTCYQYNKLIAETKGLDQQDIDAFKYIKTSGRQCFLTPIGHEHLTNLVSIAQIKIVF